VSSQSLTGNDRVAKMQFQFELVDLAHLESVLRTIKNIDSVYDAYRVNPGSAPGNTAVAATG
jgi:guanosine-3',5'-bis(diphosphate) 3'-pyrophosphohydrolase